MIISHKYKFIFIKTRKTAGTSIEVYLSQFCNDHDILTPIHPHVEPHVARNYKGFSNHMSARDIRNKVGGKLWDEYYTFCVERNPWDKTVSYYHMQNSIKPNKISFSSYLLTKDFCSDYESYTDQSGSVIVDRILKYENMDEELSEVFNDLGIPFTGTLDVKAKSEYRNNKIPYQDYFSISGIDSVARSYSREIELLGYVFDRKSFKNCIFIHSLFRSGSTYIFNKFRALECDFFCYQEPFNEHLLTLEEGSKSALEVHDQTSLKLRHPHLDKPYFYEFDSISDQVPKYLFESLCYRDFFDNDDVRGSLNAYVDLLVSNTDKTPVLQMCRSFGRLKLFSDGFNILLWRNPWDQWWSYRIDRYFSVRNLIILNADNLPRFLEKVKQELGLKSLRDASLNMEIEYFDSVFLKPEDDYFVFYSLWIYTLLEGRKEADILINIDRLTTSAEYVEYIHAELGRINVKGVDFSDCSSPIRIFSESDKTFFKSVEEKVHRLLYGIYSNDQIEKILKLKSDFSPNRGDSQEAYDPCKEVLSLRRLVFNGDNALADFSKQSDAHQRLIDELSDKVSQLHKDLTEAHGDNERLNQQYQLISSSNSWRLIKIFHPLFDKIKSFIPVKKNDYASLSASSPLSQECIVDITHVYQEDLRTGIQRVVRSVLKEFENEHNKKYAIQTVFLSSKGVYKYCDSKQIVVPKKGDVFLGLDLNARISKLDTMFSLWLDRGVKINFVVYDIIPILYPHWWNSKVSIAHEQWLRTVLRYASNVACISEVVANDLKGYCAKNPLLKDEVAKVQSFHLGADIENSQPSEGISKDADICRKKILERVTFLMVGTIEPRKGYQEALDTFNILWSKNKKINLIIVGNKGWMMDDFLSQINTHRRLNENLFYFDNASDEFLTELYENSTCLLAASEAEGFGLPLIEAAKYHLPVIARNIPVFKEITDSHASFFETGLLAEAILQWLDLYEVNKHPKNDNMPIYTWKESAQELATIVGL